MFRSKVISLFQIAAKSSQIQLKRSSLCHISVNSSCQNTYTKYLFREKLPKYRCYSSSSRKSGNEITDADSKTTETKVKAGVSKYKVFSDSESPVILDVDEERMLRLEKPELFEVEEERPDEFAGLNLKRGVNGVFDVEELVEILRRERAIDICVIKVPSDFQYVDHMVIVSGRSLKHLIAMAEFIKKLYKRKKSEDDYFPIIEGKNSTDWMAIDLGNIALHLQTKDSREKFDIEMLWAVGSEYDDKLHEKEDQYIALLKQHTALADLEPLEVQMRPKNNDNLNNSLA